MSGIQEISTIKSPPVFWYDIPYGFAQLDVYAAPEKLASVARQILTLPDEMRDRADQIFRLYALTIWELQKQRVQGCALGMHPDDQGGVTTSVLTVFSVDAQGVNPKAALACLVDADAPEVNDGDFHPVELPCGLAFQRDLILTAPMPGRPTDGGEVPDEKPVWQGMVAIPDMRSSAIIVMQLVTASVELADEYRDVLRGVASTVSFSDPSRASSQAQPTVPMPGSAAEAVRNDFG